MTGAVNIARGTASRLVTVTGTSPASSSRRIDTSAPAMRLPRGQQDGAAHGGVTGKRDLAVREEDADAGGVGRVGGRHHEDGLRQVELARDGLHLQRRQAIGVQHHRQRVAGEAAVGEDVQGVEREGHRAILGRTLRSFHWLSVVIAPQPGEVGRSTAAPGFTSTRANSPFFAQLRHAEWCPAQRWPVSRAAGPQRPSDRRRRSVAGTRVPPQSRAASTCARSFRRTA